MNLATAITLGDEGQYLGTVMIGDDTLGSTVDVTVYESLVESGRVVVDIDVHDRDEANLAVTINDGYVFGGPAAKEVPMIDMLVAPENAYREALSALLATFADGAARSGNPYRHAAVTEALALVGRETMSIPEHTS